MDEICQEVEQLLPLYVLETLEHGERDYVGAHVEVCPGCQEALAEYEQVREGLLQIQASVAPPAAVRGRLLRAAASAGRPSRLSAVFGRLGPRAPLLGTAALALVAVVLSWQVSQLNLQLEQIREQVDRNQLVQAVMTYPSSQTASLQGEDAFGTVVFDPDQRVLAVYAWGLQPLPAEQPYRAWLVSEGGDRIEAGLFNAAADDRFTMAVLWAPESMSHYTGLRIGELTATAPEAGPDSVILSADF